MRVRIRRFIKNGADILRWIFFRFTPRTARPSVQIPWASPSSLVHQYLNRGIQSSLLILELLVLLILLMFGPSQLPLVSVGGGAQCSRLASVRRSNPVCSFPALGFHNSMPFSIVPMKVSMILGSRVQTQHTAFPQAVFSSHSNANVCGAVTRYVAQSIGQVG